ncbi:MAG: glycosyltransferase [Oscillospiraceae bacterium]|nr:glycosyltransferase [Oscillospiraceae bacterium]
MVKVSCIVPVYNLENKISRCIDSILCQTLNEIEIILVNDCSTDNSIDVLNKYQIKYKNIKVIDLKENHRQGGAKNKGLMIAMGVYICFIDGDDWIEPDMLQQLYNKAEQDHLDIVDSDYYQETSTGILEIRCSIDINKFNPVAKDKILYTGRVWTKLFRKELIIRNSIQFIEHKQFEDNPYLPIVFLYTDKIGKVSKPFYHYVYNEMSTSRKRNDYTVFDRLDTAIFLLEETKNREKYEQYQEEIDFLFLKLYYVNTIVTCILGFDKPEYKYMKKAYKGLKYHLPNFMKNPYIKNSQIYIKVISRVPLGILYIFAFIVHILYRLGFKQFIIKVGSK